MRKHNKTTSLRVGLDEHGPLADQNERGDMPEGPGRVDIVDTARAMADYAAGVAAEESPHDLPSE